MKFSLNVCFIGVFVIVGVAVVVVVLVLFIKVVVVMGRREVEKPNESKIQTCAKCILIFIA